MFVVVLNLLVCKSGILNLLNLYNSNSRRALYRAAYKMYIWFVYISQSGTIIGSDFKPLTNF
jgi:hypothetical protein